MERKKDMGRKKQGKRISVIYVVGSLALAASAMVIIPKVVDQLADRFNYDVKPKDDDDWGPEIVRRENPKKED